MQVSGWIFFFTNWFFTWLVGKVTKRPFLKENCPSMSLVCFVFPRKVCTYLTSLFIFYSLIIRSLYSDCSVLIFFSYLWFLARCEIKINCSYLNRNANCKIHCKGYLYLIWTSLTLSFQACKAFFKSAKVFQLHDVNTKKYINSLF